MISIDSKPASVSKRTRVRIVALTPRGKDLIIPAFRNHSGQMRRVFSELNAEELRGLEAALKKIGKRAAALMDQS
jgi:DNA-binding MarR family transcriptional regulator